MPLTVLQDPRMKATPAQWQEQQQMITQVNQRIGEIHQQVNDLRKVTRQLEFHESMLRDKPDAKAVLDSGKALKKRIADWEASVVESRIQNGQDVINWPSRLNVEYFLLKSQLDASDPQVTAGIRTRMKDLDAEWAARRRELESIRQQVDAYNKMYQSKSYPALDYK
jgi:chromosome segregation ATPase